MLKPPKTKMQYVHFREEDKKSICGHSGVHTTKKKTRVNCPNCLAQIHKH
jgi:hypothetical protein